jgi:hypothetical protein
MGSAAARPRQRFVRLEQAPVMIAGPGGAPRSIGDVFTEEEAARPPAVFACGRRSPADGRDPRRDQLPAILIALSPSLVGLVTLPPY